MDANRKILANIAVLFSALIVFFIAGEIIFRFAIVDLNQLRGEFCYITRADGKQPKGFRKGIPGYKKTDDIIRIVCLGDSFTWGEFIRDVDDIWPKRLEVNLQPYFPDKRIEVVNLGLRGLTTVNELELLVRFGLKLEPDLVVLQYTLNDPLNSGMNLQNLSGEVLKEETKNLVPSTWLHERFLSVSKFYNFLNDRYKALQYTLTKRTIYDQLYQDDYPGWIACQNSMHGFKKLGENHDFTTILTIFPIFMSGKKTRESYEFTHIHDKVASAGKKAGLLVIDLLPTFIAQGKDFKHWRALHNRDSHPNEMANQLVADRLSEFIIQNNLLRK